jgi:tripeptide aminopeptidase
MPRWDGRPIAYPANPRLHVTPEEYPQIKRFLGEDLLHGRGDAPVGLDNKLGMAQLMTLARLLADDPSIPHGTLWLIFRPDEEIGRMRAVEGLAQHLVTLGVDVGYTIDGLDPFEINVENFQASRALFSFQGQPLALPSASCAKCLHLNLLGVKSHGATAKAEGYRNATRLLWEILALCPDAPIVPLRFQSAEDAEVNADIQLLLYGEDQAALQATEEQLSRALEMTFSPLRRRGAIWTLNKSAEVDLAQPLTDEMVQVFALLKQFFTMDKSPMPLLSEESEGFQGYTNPYFIQQSEGKASLAFRIRDFDPQELRAREQALERLHADHPHATLKIDQQYINMGPALAPYPKLIEWAKAAAAQIGVEAPRQPIRGGTGVDPFLQHGIPIANLGTGYFAPESEKEFTSRQCLAKHILWLTHLVAHIAQPA